jgi:LuxR family transcriptional regulator, maltose regulon positive regulatory protein
MLDRLLHVAQTGGRMGSVIEIHSLRALALHAMGNLGEAREAIFNALRLAKPEGFTRVFIDQGEAMRRLFLEVIDGNSTAQSGQHPLDEFDRLLAAFL